MITKKQANSLKSLIEIYKKAAIENFWSGAAHPEYKEVIELAEKVAKQQLDTLIRELTQKPDPGVSISEISKLTK